MRGAPEHVFALAFDVARRTGNPAHATTALWAFDPHTAPGVVDEALALASSLPEGDERAEALKRLRDRLDAPEEDEREPDDAGAPTASEIEAAQADEDPVERSERLMKLGRRADGHLRADLARDAISAARAIAGNQPELFQAEALLEVAPLLEQPLRGQIITEAIRIGVTMPERYLRASFLEDAAPYLLELAQSDLLACWHGALTELAQHRRGELLADLASLAPVALRLGGPTVARDIGYAIEDIVRCWGSRSGSGRRDGSDGARIPTR